MGDLPLVTITKKILGHMEKRLSNKKRHSEVGGEFSVLHTVAAGVTVNQSSSCATDVVLCRYKEFAKDTLPLHVLQCSNI